MSKKTKASGEDALLRIPAVNAEVLFKTNPDGSVVLIRVDDYEHFFEMDAVAAAAWKLINGKRTIETILDKIEKDTGFPRPRLMKDLLALISSLKDEKLITIR